MSEFLIWSFQKQAWWEETRHLYTRHIEYAARFSLEEALAICNGANYHGGEIRECIVPLIDQIKLLSLPMGYSHMLYPDEDFADVPDDLIRDLADVSAKKVLAERRLLEILTRGRMDSHEEEN